jgi:hypothetical protein
MATEPLDYTTYSTIVDLAVLRKSLRPGLTTAQGLTQLAAEHPHRPAYAAAARRYTGRQTALVAKDTPSAGPRVPVGTT